MPASSVASFRPPLPAPGARQPRLLEAGMVSARILLRSHGWGLTFADQQLPSGPPRAPAPKARSGGLSGALQGILPCTPRLALPRQQEPRRWSAFHPPGLQPGRSIRKLVRCSLHTYQTMLCTLTRPQEKPCAVLHDALYSMTLVPHDKVQIYFGLPDA